jgi:hypothetical protein
MRELLFRSEEVQEPQRETVFTPDASRLCFAHGTKLANEFSSRIFGIKLPCFLRCHSLKVLHFLFVVYLMKLLLSEYTGF